MSDILLCSEIGAWSNCHQEGVIQQLMIAKMRADTEIHSQTLGIVGVTQHKREKKTAGARQLQDSRRTWPQMQLSRANGARRAHWRHRETEEAIMELVRI